MLWYNTELLDRAGVDPAKAVTSLSALLDAARPDPEARAGHLRLVDRRQLPGHPRLRRAAAHLGDRHRQHERHGRVADAATSRATRPLRKTLEFYRTMWQEELMPRANFADAGDGLGQRLPRREGRLLPLQLRGDSAQRRRVDAGQDRGLPAARPRRRHGLLRRRRQLVHPAGRARTPPAPGSSPGSPWTSPSRQLLPEGGYTPVRGDAASGPFGQKYPAGPGSAGPPRPRLRAGHAGLQPALQPAGQPVHRDVPPRGVRRRRGRGAARRASRATTRSCGRRSCDPDRAARHPRRTRGETMTLSETRQPGSERGQATLGRTRPRRHGLPGGRGRWCTRRRRGWRWSRPRCSSSRSSSWRRWPSRSTSR